MAASIYCGTNERYGVVWQNDSVAGPFDYESAADRCAKLDLAGRRWRLPCGAEWRSATTSDGSFQNRTTWSFGKATPTGPYWAAQEAGQVENDQSSVWEIGGDELNALWGSEISIYADARARCVSSDVR